MRLLFVSLSLVILIAVAGFAAATINVYFMDVGHGDAILVQSGACEWLIDTGYKCAWPSASTCRSLFGVVIAPPIEYFILSHDHLDHYSALDLFLDSCCVCTAWSSAAEGAMARIRQEATPSRPQCGDTAGIQLGKLAAGAPSPIDANGLRWAVLHPTTQFASSAAGDNDMSLVLLLTYGAVAFLFPGDLQSIPAGAQWRRPADVDVLVLKAPHHGLSDSSTLELVRLFAPQLVVVSTDDLMPYTLPQIAGLGVPVLSTGTSGTIRVTTDGRAVWLTTDSLGGGALDFERP